MRKTVEVEYVGIEDVQEIIDDAYAVSQLGHYISVEVSSLCGVEVRVILGGFDANKDYDYSYNFYMTDKQSDVSSMNYCKETLKRLIGSEE